MSTATPTTTRRWTFADIVDAAEELDYEEKENLVDLLQHRMLEARREEVLRQIEEGERELAEGKLKAMTVDEIMEQAEA